MTGIPKRAALCLLFTSSLLAVPVAADSGASYSLSASARADGVYVAATVRGGLTKPLVSIGSPTVDAQVSTVPLVVSRATLIDMPPAMDFVVYPVLGAGAGTTVTPPYQVMATNAGTTEASTPASVDVDAGAAALRGASARAAADDDLNVMGESRWGGLRADDLGGVAIDASSGVADLRGGFSDGRYGLSSGTRVARIDVRLGPEVVVTIEGFESRASVSADGHGARAEAFTTVSAIRVNDSEIAGQSANGAALQQLITESAPLLEPHGVEMRLTAATEQAGDASANARAPALVVTIRPADPLEGGRPHDVTLVLGGAAAQLDRGKSTTSGSAQRSAPDPDLTRSVDNVEGFRSSAGTGGASMQEGSVDSVSARAPRPDVAAEEGVGSVLDTTAPVALTVAGLSVPSQLAALTAWALLALVGIQLVDPRGSASARPVRR